MFRVVSLVSVLALALVAAPAFAAPASPVEGDVPEVTSGRQVKPCIPIFIWIGHGKDAVKVWSGVCKAGTGPKS